MLRQLAFIQRQLAIPLAAATLEARILRLSVVAVKTGLWIPVTVFMRNAGRVLVAKLFDGRLCGGPRIGHQCGAFGDAALKGILYLKQTSGLALLAVSLPGQEFVSDSFQTILMGAHFAPDAHANANPEPETVALQVCSGPLYRRLLGDLHNA
jgi:hypothetical protein